METMNAQMQERVNALVDTYRDRCLWFLRRDFYPADVESALRALDHIRRHGDLKAFQQAGEIYHRLSSLSSESFLRA
jgi:hypothetical protein